MKKYQGNICFQNVLACGVLLMFFACAKEDSPLGYDGELNMYRQKAKENLAQHIETFNAYSNRPKSDGPFNSKNNKEFLLNNTPLFICSDSTITEVFNYRFWMMLKHLREYKDSMDNKTYWVYTEFFGNPKHASRSGAIPCPLGHQFYDARWVKDPQYLKSYADYFLRGSASFLNQRDNASLLTSLERPESHHFSSWLVDGIHAYLKVHPDKKWMSEMLPYMEKHQLVWDSLFTVNNPDSKTHGMYKIMDLYDGMEFSLSAVEGLIASGGPFSLYTEDTWREYYLGWNTTALAASSIQAKKFPDAFNGGYPWYYLVRPSVNSYAYGNLKSLSEMYSILGNSALGEKYGERSEKVCQKTLDVLWDEEAQFFMSYSAGDNAFGARDFKTEVRESVGYTPWYFNMIPSKNHKKYAEAWKFFNSDKGFYNTKGMTTAERRHPYYNEQAYAWNGRGWPFQNSVVYKAYANYLRNYKNDVTLSERQLLMDYVTKLAKMHGEEEKNIGEWYIPSDGKEFGGVMDYFHSSFPDIIISDVLGLKSSLDGSLTIEPLLPESTWSYFYLGDILIDDKVVDIVWNKDWEPEKEGEQSALRVWMNDKLVAESNILNVRLKL